MLVVFDDRYRAYRETIAAAIRASRPGTVVEVTEPGSLKVEMARLKPHVIICSRPNLPDQEFTLAWVELPSEPVRPATVWVKGQPSKVVDPTLNRLLSIVDEVGDLVRNRRS